MAADGVASDKARETLASAAYERLRQEIMTGTVAPGEKLNIRRLCERYQMGLSPIREALNRVSRDGLVQQSDLRGFSVAPLSLKDLEDLTRARRWLNGIALRESIARGDLDWEERVLLAYHRLSRLEFRLPETVDMINPAWEQAHRHFHAALIAACGSDWLIGFCEQLFDAANRYRYLSRKANDFMARREDEHRPIMEAAIARRPDEAVRLLEAHFEHTAELGRRELADQAPEIG